MIFGFRDKKAPEDLKFPNTVQDRPERPRKLVQVFADPLTRLTKLVLIPAADLIPVVGFRGGLRYKYGCFINLVLESFGREVCQVGVLSVRYLLEQTCSTVQYSPVVGFNIGTGIVSCDHQLFSTRSLKRYRRLCRTHRGRFLSCLKMETRHLILQMLPHISGH